jgi:hypothetical protein
MLFFNGKLGLGLMEFSAQLRRARNPLLEFVGHSWFVELIRWTRRLLALE